MTMMMNPSGLTCLEYNDAFASFKTLQDLWIDYHGHPTFIATQEARSLTTTQKHELGHHIVSSSLDINSLKLAMGGLPNDT